MAERLSPPGGGRNNPEGPAATMNRCLREPLLIFFLVGAGLFIAYAYLNPSKEAPVVLRGDGIAVLLADYEDLTGEAADAATREAIIADYYRREVLYREGLRAGLAESDGSVREAIIERMQQRVSGELMEPSGRELVNYYADHMDRYYLEPTITVEQRFLSNPPTDPESLLAALRSDEAAGFDLPPGGALLRAYGQSLLRGLFGARTLERLRTMPLETWEGPVETLRGWHYFRVLAREPARLQSFERARDQVLADYQADEVARRLQAFVDARRDRYPLDLRP